MNIGNININNTGCPCDMALLSENPIAAQILVNITLDFANLEVYKLQPKAIIYMQRQPRKICN